MEVNLDININILLIWTESMIKYSSFTMYMIVLFRILYILILCISIYNTYFIRVYVTLS